MSRTHYGLDNKEHSISIRATVKLLNAASASYGGDWHSVPHTHNHMELFCITAGKGQFLIEGKLYPVDTSMLVIINRNVIHTEIGFADAPLEYIVLGLEGLDLPAEGGSNGQFVILENFIESKEIFSCIRSILREMERKNPGFQEICQAYTEIMTICLMRSIQLAVPEQVQAGIGNRQCAAAKRYIDMHFKESISLDQLAEQVHINKYYLSHAFKREYGISPMNYMTVRRIEESKYLLSETDLSPSHIAQLLGFSSPSYFSQVFRRSENTSPMEYRQSNRGK